MTVVRKCEQCGHVDTRAKWSSPEEAAKDPYFDKWTCPTCAWTESELVEAEEQPATA
jgi:hypothetical protein